MISTLSSASFWHFSVCVGLGSMLVFDLWCLLTRAMGVVLVDWSMLGCRITGLFRGHRSVCETCQMRVMAHSGNHTGQRFALHAYCLRRNCAVPPGVLPADTPPGYAPAGGHWALAGHQVRPSHFRATKFEVLLGWGLHYVVGIFTVSLMPLIWGMDFLYDPEIAPVLLCGFCMPSVVAQILTLPALRRRREAKNGRALCCLHLLTLSGHFVYAMAILGFAQSGIGL